MQEVIQSQRFLGPSIPVDTGSSRNSRKYILGQNATPSLSNPVFFKPGEFLERRKKETGGVKTEVSPEIFDLYQRPVEVIRAFADSIALSAQKRVAAFYSQLVLSYKTYLHFEEGKTFDQAESAPTCLIVNAEDGRSYKLKMDASHNSTIPCIYAYKLDEWNKYRESLLGAEAIDKPKGFVYLSGSDAYRFSNSTIEMPKAFNIKVDNTIDLGEQGLRRAGLHLLNKAATGEITPEEGLMSVLRDFQRIIQTKMRVTEDEDKLLGLELYEQELIEIKSFLESDESAFDVYLNIRTEREDAESANIRHTIYQLRYEAIQRNFSKQAEIAEKINLAKTRIFKSFRYLPSYAQEAFNELLIHSTKLKEDEIRLKKFFNAPYSIRDTQKRERGIAQAKERLSEVMVQTVDPATRKTHETGLEVIQSLGRNLSKIMATMRSNEIEERGRILHTLRKMRHLSRKALGQKIKDEFPNSPASQSTIFRSEKGERAITETYANQLSKVLRVPRALFTPQFFNA